MVNLLPTSLHYAECQPGWDLQMFGDRDEGAH
jgi:hypothetical protein